MCRNVCVCVCVCVISSVMMLMGAVKIGIHVGDVTAGVVGITKPQYDLWGNVSSDLCFAVERPAVQSLKVLGC